MRRTLLLALLILACVPAAAAASDSRIVGGGETEKTWPWMVYLDQGRQEVEPQSMQFCGGSLIAPTWVLTAAHCPSLTLGLVPGDGNLAFPITTVVIGRHDLNDSDSGERIQAKRIIMNPSYESRGDDTALIELERAPANPQPVKIAGPNETALWAAGTMATILGWGNTESGGASSDVLKEAQVPVTTDEYCGKAYSDPSWGWEPSIMICAGFPEGGTDTCQGDSGGPLVVPAADGTWRHIGATSFGEGCAEPNFPGVYAETASGPIQQWIAEYVPDAISREAAIPPAPPPVQSAPAQASGTQPAASSQPAPPSTAPKRAAAKKHKSCRKKASKIKNKKKRKAALRRCAAKKKRASRR